MKGPPIGSPSFNTFSCVCSAVPAALVIRAFVGAAVMAAMAGLVAFVARVSSVLAVGGKVARVPGPRPCVAVLIASTTGALSSTFAAFLTFAPTLATGAGSFLASLASASVVAPL